MNYMNYMNESKTYLAIDLGATSGRTILGRKNGEQIDMEVLTRFDNPIIQANGHFYWDIYALYHEIIKALRLVAQRNITIESIGIDTWGCDIVCLGHDGQLLRNPLSYRDPHTFPMMEHYFEHQLSREDVYMKTGVQLMNFNTLFQLYAMRQAGNAALENAEKILFIPDALIYMLTGKVICEYTVASTSQLLNPYTREFDEDLLKSVGLTREHFGPMTAPGTIVGPLSEEVQRITGLKDIPVMAVAGHDTASAVSVIPTDPPGQVFLSSGTWSLMGVVTGEPIINRQTFEQNFTNEGGVNGTIRFLKNSCGMWIYERCREEWGKPSHDELIGGAEKCQPTAHVFNTDDARFANPPSMVAAIKDYFDEQGWPMPQSRAEIVRCIFESLAHRYKEIYDRLCELAPGTSRNLHIIGGGSRNQLLNQLTEKACNCNIIIGSAEATAYGNLKMQMNR